MTFYRTLLVKALRRSTPNLVQHFICERHNYHATVEGDKNHTEFNIPPFIAVNLSSLPAIDRAHARQHPCSIGET